MGNNTYPGDQRDVTRFKNLCQLRQKLMISIYYIEIFIP